jgi:hypothetical protein
MYIMDQFRILPESAGRVPRIKRAGSLMKRVLGGW